MHPMYLMWCFVTPLAAHTSQKPTSTWPLISHTEDSLIACDMSVRPTVKINTRL